MALVTITDYLKSNRNAYVDFSFWVNLIGACILRSWAKSVTHSLSIIPQVVAVAPNTISTTLLIIAILNNREMNLYVAAVATTTELVAIIAKLSPSTTTLDHSNPRSEQRDARMVLATGTTISCCNNITKRILEGKLQTEFRQKFSIHNAYGRIDLAGNSVCICLAECVCDCPGSA